MAGGFWCKAMRLETTNSATDVDNRDDNDAPGRVSSLLSIGYQTSG